ncbi:MAG TPA: hypothetical protein VGI99_00485, partial [Gemmataceae bacterium]
RYLMQAWLRPIAAASIPAAIWWFATPVDAAWWDIIMAIAIALIPYAIVVGAIEGAAVLYRNQSRTSTGRQKAPVWPWKLTGSPM